MKRIAATLQAIWRCPVCRQTVQSGVPRQGAMSIICPTCGAETRVYWADPPRVEFVSMPKITIPDDDDDPLGTGE